MEDTAKVLTTPEYLRVLDEEKELTFETNVNGQISHHQISIIEFDTREKIEARMAEVLAQVKEELAESNNVMRDQPIPLDIQSLVDEQVAVDEQARATLQQEQAVVE